MKNFFSCLCIIFFTDGTYDLRLFDTEEAANWYCRIIPRFPFVKGIIAQTNLATENYIITTIREYFYLIKRQRIITKIKYRYKKKLKFFSLYPH